MRVGWQRTIAEHYPNISYDICSYNMLSKKYKQYTDYFVIFDECHRLKNSTKVWGKAGFELTKIARGFILLSATPIPNGWEDAINYFKMFNLTKNKTRFIKENAIINYDEGYGDIVGWRNEIKLKNMWNSISRRLSKDEATDLPDLVFDQVHFKVSRDYKIIQQNRILNDVAYDNIMKLRHGLRSHCNIKEKIEYLKNFIEDTTDNIVVFYNYDVELEELKTITNKKIYVCNGYEKTYPKKDEWDKVTNTVTIANYKSGSEAVEFTYANIIIYFSPTESYTEFYQSYGRCYRNGQTKKVTIYKFITKGSIEEDIYRSLDTKQDFNLDLWVKKEGLK